LPSRVLSTVLRLEPYLLQILPTHRISSLWFLYFFVYAACASGSACLMRVAALLMFTNISINNNLSRLSYSHHAPV
jgi:hypothetical protein